MRGIWVAWLLAGVLTMTACGGTAATSAAPGGSGSTSPLPSYASARDELAAGFARTEATTSTYAAESADAETDAVEGRLTGVSDPARRALSGEAQFKGGAAGHLESIVIGDDLFKRGGSLPTAGNWTHANLARAPLAVGVGFPVLVSLVASAGAAIVDAEKTGPGAFKGTLDPAKTAKASVVYSAKAKVFPFEATLDAQGHVTSVVLHPQPVIDMIKPVTLTIRLTDFGKPVTIAAPPASEVEEMSEYEYQLYGA